MTNELKIVMTLGPRGIAFRAFGKDSPEGGEKLEIRQAPPVERHLIDELRQGSPRVASVVETANKVSQWLLQTDLQPYLNVALQNHEQFRLIFYVDPDLRKDVQLGEALADLPLELLQLPERVVPLVLDPQVTAFIHLLDKVHRSHPPEHKLPLRVLIVRSNPVDLGGAVPDPAPIRQEILNLGLRFGPKLVEVDMLSRQPGEGVIGLPTPEGLWNLLASAPLPYDILVYLGHGDRAQNREDLLPLGLLYLESPDGTEGEPVTADRLAQELQNHPVPVVLLMGCLTAADLPAIQKDAILSTMPRAMRGNQGVAQALVNSSSGVQIAVGMRYKLESNDARDFLSAFFKSLLYDHAGDVEAAVHHGREKLHAVSANKGSWSAPVMFSALPGEPIFGFLRKSKPPRQPEKRPLEVNRYLPLRLQHFEQFLGHSLEPRHLKIEGFEQISKLRFKLLHQKLLNKPRILTVSGTMFPCGLLNSGWWERAGGYRPTRIRWRDPVQAWLFNGFDLWAPSWDFSWNLDSSEVAPKKPCFVAQLGSGDEADSLPVVLQYEKAKGIRDDFIYRGGCLEVELTGLLGRREHFTAKLGESGKELEEKLRIFGGLLDYCLWLSDEEKKHTIKVLRDETEMYSGYLWKCLAPKEWLKDEEKLKLDDVYFVWEHTNFASKETIKYNLDSLERKEQYIRSMHGDLVLIQKSSSLVPGEPKLLSEDIYDLLLRGRCGVVK